MSIELLVELRKQSDLSSVHLSTSLRSLFRTLPDLSVGLTTMNLHRAALCDMLADLSLCKEQNKFTVPDYTKQVYRHYCL